MSKILKFVVIVFIAAWLVEFMYHGERKIIDKQLSYEAKVNSIIIDRVEYKNKTKDTIIVLAELRCIGNDDVIGTERFIFVNGKLQNKEAFQSFKNKCKKFNDEFYSSTKDR